MTWAAEHVVGVAKGVDPEIIEGLRMNPNGECSARWACICQWRAWHIVRVIRRLVCIGKKQLMKKLSMLRSLSSQ